MADSIDNYMASWVLLIELDCKISMQQNKNLQRYRPTPAPFLFCALRLRRGRPLSMAFCSFSHFLAIENCPLASGSRDTTIEEIVIWLPSSPPDFFGLWKPSSANAMRMSSSPTSNIVTPQMPRYSPRAPPTSLKIWNNYWIKEFHDLSMFSPNATINRKILTSWLDIS